MPLTNNINLQWLDKVSHFERFMWIQWLREKARECGIAVDYIGWEAGTFCFECKDSAVAFALHFAKQPSEQPNWSEYVRV